MHYVHLSESAITGSDGLALARLEQGNRILDADQVRAWCARPETTVVVKPVIDLTDTVYSGSYEIRDGIAERVILRDRTCVFPRCTRTARACDLDHIVAWDAGGPTSTHNLAPLCRHHHRLKTHGRWIYRRCGPAAYEWISPHGHRYLRDAAGTSTSKPADT